MSTKPPSNKPKVDIDPWLDEVLTGKGCNTCAHKEAAKTLEQIFKAMMRKQAHAVPLRDIHKKLKELHPDYNVGFWGFRAHIYECARPLYRRARGKDHA